MTRLSTFRKESAFSTWVYRIAVNHLKDCRSHQFAHADSRTAADVLGITPEAYRQRLSRARKTVVEFLGAYCQHGESQACSCARRVDFAIATHRLAPRNVEYLELTEDERAQDAFVGAMDELDGYASLFDQLPAYRPTPRTKKLLEACMGTASFSTVMNADEEVSCA